MCFAWRAPTTDETDSHVNARAAAPQAQGSLDAFAARPAKVRGAIPGRDLSAAPDQVRPWPADQRSSGCGSPHRPAARR